MVYYVYIIRSQKDGRFYIGQTHNLERRIEQHNQGQSGYTKKYLPWELFAYKTYETRKDAMRNEKKIKNLKSRKRVMEFIQRN